MRGSLKLLNPITSTWDFYYSSSSWVSCLWFTPLCLCLPPLTVDPSGMHTHTCSVSMYYGTFHKTMILYCKNIFYPLILNLTHHRKLYAFLNLKGHYTHKHKLVCSQTHAIIPQINFYYQIYSCLLWHFLLPQWEGKNDWHHYGDHWSGSTCVYGDDFWLPSKPWTHYSSSASHGVRKNYFKNHDHIIQEKSLTFLCVISYSLAIYYLNSVSQAYQNANLELKKKMQMVSSVYVQRYTTIHFKIC